MQVTIASRIPWWVVAISLGVATSRATSAVEPGAASPASDAAAVDEVIITAGKSPEPLQRAPLSVRVVDAALLDRASVLDLDDLPQLVPSLTVSKTTQPANNGINIRGIGTYAFSIAVEPSVSVVIDDIPQAFQATAFTALVDVAQVEVLRGPQNTLFGKASSAGVIRVTTRPVSDVFTGRLHAMLTDDHERRVQASVSGPLGARSGYRVAAGLSGFRGTLYNLSTGQWVNGQSDANLRGRVDFRPDDRWTVSVLPFWSRTDGTCCTAAETFVPAGTTTGSAATGARRIPVAQFLDGVTPGPGNRRLRMDVDPRGDSRHAGTGLRIERSGERVQLLSLTSFEDYSLEDRQDTDSTDIDFSRYQPISPAGGSANGGRVDVSALTQEFRITGAPGAPLRYVAGLFAGETRAKRLFVRGSNALDDYSLVTPPGAPGRPPVPANLPTTNDTSYARYVAFARTENLAAFGQGTYALRPTLDLIAGLRIGRERIAYTFRDEVNDVTFGLPRCAGTTPSGIPIRTCDEETAATGRLGLRWQADPRLMLFATWSRGRKGRAWDLSSTLTQRGPAPSTSPWPGRPLADAVAAGQPVPAETVDNHEAGFKGRWFDGRLSGSATAFRMSYRNLQAQSRDLLLNQNVLNSVGRVTSAGVEAELGAQWPGVAVDVAGAWNRARIDEFPRASCYRGQAAAAGCVGGVQDLAGRTLPNAPEWSVVTTIQHDRPVTAALRAVVSAGFRWQSAVNHSLLQDPAARQGDYGVLNLSAGLRTASWQATAFANNVTDRQFLLNGARDAHLNSPSGTFATSWRPAREAQRSVGVRLVREF